MPVLFFEDLESRLLLSAAVPWLATVPNGITTNSYGVLNVAANAGNGPVLAAGATSVGYGANHNSVAFFPDLVISDGSATTLVSASFTLNGYVAGEDIFGITSVTGITVQVIDNTIVMTGSAPLASYQTLLRSITYSNTSSSPSTVLRTASLTVNDGTADSNIITCSISQALVALAVTDSTMDEGDANNTAVFTISRSAGTADSLRVYYTLAGTSALTQFAGYNYLTSYAGVNYGYVDFAAGQETVTVTLHGIDDHLPLGTTTVQVALYQYGTYWLDQNATTGQATIADAAAIISLATTDSTMDEADAGNTAIFTLSRTGYATDSLRVYYQLLGTAALTEYTGFNFLSYSGGVVYGWVDFAAGQATTTITLHALNDNLPLGTTTVQVRLFQVGCYGTDANNLQGQATIADAASIISLASTGSTMDEGDPANTVVFTLSRTGSTAGSLRVYYQLRGTAALTEYTGYNFLSYTGGVVYGWVDFAAGQTTTTITLHARNDNLPLGTTTVQVRLFQVGCYGTDVNNLQGQATIADAAPIISLATTDGTMAEADPSNTVTFVLSRTGSTADSLRVYYQLLGTAAITEYTGYNFLGTYGGVTYAWADFAAGQATTTLTLHAIDDHLGLGTTTVQARLFQFGCYATDANNLQGLATIADAAPIISLATTDSTMDEADANNTAIFKLTRTGSTAESLRVYYQLSGTAAFAEYTGYNFLCYSGGVVYGSVDFAAGQATSTITLHANDDQLARGTTTMQVRLFQYGSYLADVNNLQGQATIADAAPQLSITTGTGTLNEAAPAQTAAFTLSRTGSTARALRVYYQLTGTAALRQFSGYHFLGNFGGVNYAWADFAAGQASATLTFNGVNDHMHEGATYVQVQLYQFGQYLLTENSLSGQISLVDAN